MAAEDLRSQEDVLKKKRLEDEAEAAREEVRRRDREVEAELERERAAMQRHDPHHRLAMEWRAFEAFEDTFDYHLETTKYPPYVGKSDKTKYLYEWPRMFEEDQRLRSWLVGYKTIKGPPLREGSASSSGASAAS